jgi:hypothetical protein
MAYTEKIREPLKTLKSRLVANPKAEFTQGK